MLTIIPAILTNDPKELEEKIRLLEGIAERIQIDIIDGVFADNKTVMPDILGGFETDLLIDFQLITKEPIDWVEHCIRGMADRIFGHIEMMSSQIDFIGKVQEVGAKVGLALDLETSIDAIPREIITNLDAILVMSVKAGFGGQDFNPLVLNKIKELNSIRARRNTKFRICVDGGVNEENIQEVVAAGADEVAIGAHIFKEELVEHIKKLQQAVYGKN